MWKYNMILPSTARPEQNEPGHQATYNLRRPISHGKPRTMLRKQLDCPQAVFGLGGAWHLQPPLKKVRLTPLELASGVWLHDKRGAQSSWWYWWWMVMTNLGVQPHIIRSWCLAPTRAVSEPTAGQFVARLTAAGCSKGRHDARPLPRSNRWGHGEPNRFPPMSAPLGCWSWRVPLY